MKKFAMSTSEERHEMRLTACPPHVRKSWLLGCARRERLEARKVSVATVAGALHQCPRFVFAEEAPSWRRCSTVDMSEDVLHEAQAAWREAEVLERAMDHENTGVGAEARPVDELERLAPTDRLCHSVLDSSVRQRMDTFMRARMKWTHRELHDALLFAGLAVPALPSLVNCFSVLYSQFGNAQVGFMPQAFLTHAKANVQQLLKCLSRTGVKLGGKLADKKSVLVERLAHWLNQVVEDGREARTSDASGEEGSDEEVEDHAAPQKRRRHLLIPETRAIEEVPYDAIVTAEQAESALGHVQATEFDEAALEVLDLELRQEEEALAGRHVNPNGIDYSCLHADSQDAHDAVTFGWDAAGMSPCHLSRTNFAFTADDMQTRLQQGAQALYSGFEESLRAGSDADLASLDPTQRLAYDVVDEWATKRLSWLSSQSLTTTSSQSLTTTPLLRMLLLGTAGTGKTYTAKLAIARARRTFGSFHLVLTVAYSGAAAANLGDGARTVDSVFHTNTEHAAEDLTGEALDKIVLAFRHVQLLVIDEVSTVGAPAFEIISRRLEQVGKVLCRERHGHRAPDSLGGFGGIGVVLIGDFAQLPPVLSSSLLSDAAIEEKRSSGSRSMTLAGRQTFQSFEQIVRLRRVHRLLGIDHFKESTLRLRDAAFTMEDYAL